MFVCCEREVKLLSDKSGHGNEHAVTCNNACGGESYETRTRRGSGAVVA